MAFLKKNMMLTITTKIYHSQHVLRQAMHQALPLKQLPVPLVLDAGTLKPDEELEINGLKWQKINLGAAILRHV